MKTDKKAYNRMVKESIPPSRMVRNFFTAFSVGGCICVVGQIMRSLLFSLGMEEQRVGLLVTIFMIALSALLTGTGLYSKLARYSGAGTLVPITGYANAVASPAIEFKTEGWLTGVSVKMFSVAGPVIVLGLVVTSLIGAIYYALMLWGVL